MQRFLGYIVDFSWKFAAEIRRFARIMDIFSLYCKGNFDTFFCHVASEKEIFANIHLIFGKSCMICEHKLQQAAFSEFMSDPAKMAVLFASFIEQGVLHFTGKDIVFVFLSFFE